MRRQALLAIGRDRPGIVASLTEALLRHDVNVEDSQMTILRGHFTMMLILAVPDEVDLDGLRDDLSEVEAIELWSLGDVEGPARGPEPSHLVTVYGADHPGIVHAVSSALAERGIDITDLNSRLLEEGAEPLYVLMLEIAVPPASRAAEVAAALGEVGSREGVEVTLRELDLDEL